MRVHERVFLHMKLTHNQINLSIRLAHRRVCLWLSHESSHSRTFGSDALNQNNSGLLKLIGRVMVYMT